MLRPGGYGLLSIDQVENAVLLGFDCGKTHLNEFLIESAGPMHRNRLGFTSVVFHQDFDGVLGYFTLSNDAIPLKSSEAFEYGIEDPLLAFPGVKIGRLAVSAKAQGKGAGSEIMKLILGEVLDGQSLSSARLLIVDADSSEDVLAFYGKHGFERSLWAADQAKNHAKKGEVRTVKMIRDVLR